MYNECMGLIYVLPEAHVSLSSMDEVTDATSKFSFTVETEEGWLPMESL